MQLGVDMAEKVCVPSPPGGRAPGRRRTAGHDAGSGDKEPGRVMCSPRLVPWSTASIRTSMRRSNRGSGVRRRRPRPRRCSGWVGVRRGDQLDSRRAMLPASPRIQRSHDRPGDQAYFDIIHAFNGDRTAITGPGGRAGDPGAERCLQTVAGMDGCRNRARKARGQDRRHRQGVARGARVRIPGRDGAFGLQFGHGVGVGLHERPIISRLNSLDDPVEIQAACSSPSETHAPSQIPTAFRHPHQGRVVVTADGPKVITLFPWRS